MRTWVLPAIGVEVERVVAVLTAVVGHSARLTLRVAGANASAHLRQLLMVLIPTSTSGSASLQAAELRIRSPVVQLPTLRRPQMQHRTLAPSHDVAYRIAVHGQAVPHDEAQHLLMPPW